MKTLAAVLLNVLVLTIASNAQPPSNPEVVTAPRANFDLQKIADGVYAVIRKDRPGLMCDGNSAFIINDNDVVVVDTNGSPSEAKEMVAALRRLTPKPVKYVINTHWHDDHIMGNQVFRDAFPGAEFIAHANTREYLPTKGVTARDHMLKDAPEVVAMMRALVQKNKNFAGEDLTPEERATYLSDIAMVDRYVAEVPATQIVLPTLTVDDRLTLHRGSHTIDVRYMGRGHTSGDIVVHLPEQGVLITGDLVVWPVPLVGSDQSHVADWSSTLEKMRALRPTIIIPGHGPVMRDDSYMKLMSDLFASVQQQTNVAVANGESLDQTRKSVNLDKFRRAFAGDDKIKNLLFSNYVASPAVASAFSDASGKSAESRGSATAR